MRYFTVDSAQFGRLLQMQKQQQREQRIENRGIKQVELEAKKRIAVTKKKN